eukprot:GHVP01004393.1.p1 GENE.GHVP01004393.1~~GHVP01004393.1.p1  ORF type:complete len:1210 (+),score=201.01 GHVP01004393.1:19-3648(+)
MKIVEFRVRIPVTLEAYHRGFLYSIAKKSLQESLDTPGDGVTVLETESFQHENFGTGIYTNKRISFASKVPSWLQMILSKEVLCFDETAWNSFPFCKTEYIQRSISGFKFQVLTFHIEGKETDVEANLAQLEDQILESRKIITVDLIKDNTEEMRDRLLRQKFNNPHISRIPPNYADDSEILMTAIKAFVVDIPVPFFSSRIESFVIDLMHNMLIDFHSEMLLNMDNWIGLSLPEVRLYEDKIAAKLAKIQEAWANDGVILTSAIASDSDSEVEEVEFTTDNIASQFDMAILAFSSLRIANTKPTSNAFWSAFEAVHKNERVNYKVLETHSLIRSLNSTSVRLEEDSINGTITPKMTPTKELYSGFLYKLSDGYISSPTWNSRYVLLHGSQFFYFDDPREPRPRGMADLYGASVFLSNEFTELTENNFCLVLTPIDQKPLIFRGATSAETEDWLSIFQYVACVQQPSGIQRASLIASARDVLPTPSTSPELSCSLHRTLSEPKEKEVPYSEWLEKTIAQLERVPISPNESEFVVTVLKEEFQGYHEEWSLLKKQIEAISCPDDIVLKIRSQTKETVKSGLYNSIPGKREIYAIVHLMVVLFLIFRYLAQEVTKLGRSCRVILYPSVVFKFATIQRWNLLPTLALKLAFFILPKFLTFLGLLFLGALPFLVLSGYEPPQEFGDSKFSSLVFAIESIEMQIIKKVSKFLRPIFSHKLTYPIHKPQIEHSLVIDAPASTVFFIIMNPEFDSLWKSGHHEELSRKRFSHKDVRTDISSCRYTTRLTWNWWKFQPILAEFIILGKIWSILVKYFLPKSSVVLCQNSFLLFKDSSFLLIKSSNADNAPKFQFSEIVDVRPLNHCAFGYHSSSTHSLLKVKSWIYLRRSSTQMNRFLTIGRARSFRKLKDLAERIHSMGYGRWKYFEASNQIPSNRIFLQRKALLNFQISHGQKTPLKLFSCDSKHQEFGEAVRQAFSAWPSINRMFSETSENPQKRTFLILQLFVSVVPHLNVPRTLYVSARHRALQGTLLPLAISLADGTVLKVYISAFDPEKESTKIKGIFEFQKSKFIRKIEFCVHAKASIIGNNAEHDFKDSYLKIVFQNETIKLLADKYKLDTEHFLFGPQTSHLESELTISSVLYPQLAGSSPIAIEEPQEHRRGKIRVRGEVFEAKLSFDKNEEIRYEGTVDMLSCPSTGEILWSREQHTDHKPEFKI